jgi:hypothetical protein
MPTPCRDAQLKRFFSVHARYVFLPGRQERNMETLHSSVSFQLRAIDSAPLLQVPDTSPDNLKLWEAHNLLEPS